jgi:hypothetical protein
MEDFETLDNTISDKGFTGQLLSYGSTIAKWTKVIAIIGIVSAVLDLFYEMYINIANVLGGLISVVVTISLYLSLHRFSESMKKFSETGTNESFAAAMYRQRMFWQFIGILCIIVLFFILILVAVAGGDLLAFLNRL